MRILKTIFIIVIFAVLTATTQAQKFMVAVLPTPVLNTSDFHSVFGGESGMDVKRDNQGLIRELEFIALPNTLFEIVDEIPMDGYNIYKITTTDYPYNSSELFIDSRFVKSPGTEAFDRSVNMPTKSDIIAKLNELDGYQYMWGGNYAYGITQLMEYYPPSAEIADGYLEKTWCLEGVDCSGLIYQATNGSTPRNTSSLVYYGNPVEIESKTPEEIAALVEPLDFIVWKGHLIIVLDKNTVIESSNPEGVHKTNLLDRLYSVMESRTPVNDYDVDYGGSKFVIRRWIESEN